MQPTADEQTSAQLLGMFCFSLILTGFDNGMTVAMNLGSALWTSSAVNLSHAFNVSLLTILLIEGVAVVLFNATVLGYLDGRRIAGNLIDMIPFSFLVSGFANLIKMTPLVALNSCMAMRQLPNRYRFYHRLFWIFYVSASRTRFTRSTLGRFFLWLPKVP